MPGASDEVTPDGSPVPVYLALPAGDTPKLVHGAVVSGGSILELGCGAGRLTRPLVALGHQVVAVDSSPAMLEHVTGAKKVCADLFSLDLDRRFDAVLAASHLIDQRQQQRRRALLSVCRRHVDDDGVVVVQRHDPDWARQPADTTRPDGPVDISFRLIDGRETEFDGEVTYRLGDRSWTQTFTAGIVDDEELRADASACGLHLERWLDERKMWAVLRPIDSA